jgi:hypothetical protein
MDSIYNFRKYYLKTGNAKAAIGYRPDQWPGHAGYVNCAFLRLLCDASAYLSHTSRFGVFTGITIMFALLADLILAPALMIIIIDSRKKKGQPPGQRQDHGRVYPESHSRE